MIKTVYIVLYTLSVGGAERHASSIANYLSEHGYDVKILLLQNDIIEYSLQDDIEVIPLSNLKYPNTVTNSKVSFVNRILLKIYKKISEKKYEFLDKKLYIESLYLRKLDFYFSTQNSIEQSIVLSFMAIPNITTAILKSKFRYKLILGEFTSPQLEFEIDSPENQLKQMYFPNADGFVFQTYEQEEFYSYLTEVKKIVIPNPIEEISINPFYGKRKKEIVNYCKHVKAKNLPLLIHSFAKIVREYPEYKLVIYGDGPERNNTEKCVVDHGIQDSVFLKPYARNVLELVRDSAMFVSSSDREGISNSMLEAMAIGLPTICTDCPAGGARMFIESYKNGIVVPVNDSEALYEAMKYFIDNPDKAQNMSKNAIDIRKTLEKKKILQQWHDFLSSI